MGLAWIHPYLPQHPVGEKTFYSFVEKQEKDLKKIQFHKVALSVAL